ncbi:MAG: hypothetical protein QOC81_64 [Thermoanaerobaculia bacterium]|nr:hypothetical protein [Thermoanaerobaculia bacterium]
MRDDRTILERFCDIEASTEAIRRGVRRALWRHKQLGQSVAIWKDGKVVILKPEEIQVERPD